MLEKKTMLVIADNDPQRLHFLTQHLQAEGYSVVAALDEDHVLDQLQTNIPDLLLLAMTFSCGEGIQFCQRVRACSAVPLLLLVTDRREQIHGLHAGADDCVVCPFSLSELLARVRALLRRMQGARRDRPDIVHKSIGELTIDSRQYLVTMRGEALTLSPLEYRLLLCLAQHAGRVVSYDYLLRFVWGQDAQYENHHLLQTCVYRLRRKLEEDPNRPRYLLTKVGFGYYLPLHPLSDESNMHKHKNPSGHKKLLKMHRDW